MCTRHHGRSSGRHQALGKGSSAAHPALDYSTPRRARRGLRCRRWRAARGRACSAEVGAEAPRREGELLLNRDRDRLVPHLHARLGVARRLGEACRTPASRGRRARQQCMRSPAKFGARDGGGRGHGERASNVARPQVKCSVEGQGQGQGWGSWGVARSQIKCSVEASSGGALRPGGTSKHCDRQRPARLQDPKSLSSCVRLLKV